jgi:hypothetical protein
MCIIICELRSFKREAPSHDGIQGRENVTSVVNLGGHTKAQAVSCWPPIIDAHV